MSDTTPITLQDLINLKQDLRENLRRDIREDIREDIKTYQEEMKSYVGSVQEDMKTYVGAIAEKFSSDVQLLAEQQSEMKKDISAIKDTLELVVETLGDVKVEVTGLRQDHESLERRVTHIESVVVLH